MFKLSPSALGSFQLVSLELIGNLLRWFFLPNACLSSALYMFSYSSGFQPKQGNSVDSELHDLIQDYTPYLLLLKNNPHPTPRLPFALLSVFKDNPLSVEDSNLGDVKRLSKSNIDISGLMEDEGSQQLLPWKQSDSSSFDCDAITQHHTFLSR